MFEYDTESLSMIQGHTIKTLKVESTPYETEEQWT